MKEKDKGSIMAEEICRNAHHILEIERIREREIDGFAEKHGGSIFVKNDFFFFNY